MRRTKTADRARLALPPVIGHRGAAGSTPENTLAGFRQAARLGASWVELDVHLTADGRLAVIHDSTLARTTNGRGRVARRTVAQLAELDAGGWFGSRFRGEPLPMLEDALALIAELDLGVNVEIKPARGREAPTLAALKRAIAAAWRVPGPPLLLSSFERRAVAVAAEVLPKIPRALVSRRMPRDWREIAARLGCAGLHLDHRHLDPLRVLAIKSSGLALAAYTVNDPGRAVLLWSWGVDALFSDSPDLLLAEQAKAK